MNKKSKKNHREIGSPSPSRGAGKRSWAMIVAMFLLVGIAGLGVWWSQTHKADGVASTEPADVNVAESAQPDFARLKGRWLRPDGDYVLEIKNVDGNGRLDAGYYNPNPIHVSKAETSRSAGALKLFVELRDVNYPGSTYSLTYDPSNDRLVGDYYQAVEKETYEIFFERMK